MARIGSNDNSPTIPNSPLGSLQAPVPKFALTAPKLDNSRQQEGQHPQSRAFENPLNSSGELIARLPIPKPSPVKAPPVGTGGAARAPLKIPIHIPGAAPVSSGQYVRPHNGMSPEQRDQFTTVVRQHMPGLANQSDAVVDYVTTAIGIASATTQDQPTALRVLEEKLSDFNPNNLIRKIGNAVGKFFGLPASDLQAAANTLQNYKNNITKLADAADAVRAVATLGANSPVLQTYKAEFNELASKPMQFQGLNGELNRALLGRLSQTSAVLKGYDSMDSQTAARTLQTGRLLGDLGMMTNNLIAENPRFTGLQNAIQQLRGIETDRIANLGKDVGIGNQAPSVPTPPPQGAQARPSNPPARPTPPPVAANPTPPTVNPSVSRPTAPAAPPPQATPTPQPAEAVSTARAAVNAALQNGLQPEHLQAVKEAIPTLQAFASSSDATTAELAQRTLNDLRTLYIKTRDSLFNDDDSVNLANAKKVFGQGQEVQARVNRFYFDQRSLGVVTNIYDTVGPQNKLIDALEKPSQLAGGDRPQPENTATEDTLNRRAAAAVLQNLNALTGGQLAQLASSGDFDAAEKLIANTLSSEEGTKSHLMFLINAMDAYVKKHGDLPLTPENIRLALANAPSASGEQETAPWMDQLNTEMTRQRKKKDSTSKTPTTSTPAGTPASGSTGGAAPPKGPPSANLPSPSFPEEEWDRKKHNADDTIGGGYARYVRLPNGNILDNSVMLQQTGRILAPRPGGGLQAFRPSGVDMIRPSTIGGQVKAIGDALKGTLNGVNYTNRVDWNSVGHNLFHLNAMTKIVLGTMGGAAGGWQLYQGIRSDVQREYGIAAYELPPFDPANSYQWFAEIKKITTSWGDGALGQQMAALAQNQLKLANEISGILKDEKGNDVLLSDINIKNLAEKIRQANEYVINISALASKYIDDGNSAPKTLDQIKEIDSILRSLPGWNANVSGTIAAMSARQQDTVLRIIATPLSNLQAQVNSARGIYDLAKSERVRVLEETKLALDVNIAKNTEANVGLQNQLLALNLSNAKAQQDLQDAQAINVIQGNISRVQGDLKREYDSLVENMKLRAGNENALREANWQRMENLVGYSGQPNDGISRQYPSVPAGISLRPVIDEYGLRILTPEQTVAHAMYSLERAGINPELLFQPRKLLTVDPGKNYEATPRFVEQDIAGGYSSTISPQKIAEARRLFQLLKENNGDLGVFAPGKQ